ncbi:hypothetical protein GQ55_1G001800 [Panicum hallii var. hallii]|uniref:Wall-associated receptor kinase galacturonan-binding domain-containing protein n=1 Tax=Panicum hallii var. hallii TaxID=1504633 RepID=A0A2T7F0L2_9POAL|nr:hypothetical protein GQ55_1G001800 [Panicum hallii var. hallii]
MDMMAMKRLPIIISCLTILLVAFAPAAAEATAPASTVVAGMVFCDQCKDGARGLFDYPLYGARVAIQCGGGDTPLTVRESNTNWFGGFSIRMEGSPDMNRCTARVVQGTGHCGAATAGAPRELTLAFRMLGLALYTVPPLLSQPEEAMDFCPGRDRRRPPPAAARWPAAAPAPAPPLASFWRRRRLPPIWRKPPTLPQQDQPEPPHVPPPPPPPAPAQGSACTYEQWASPEHRCHWKVVTPNTTVAMAFGPLAAQRYGSELTLRDALEGRGDMYRTLLREATAALLNAYYNAPGGPFLYPTTASVIDHMNGALLSSTQRVLIEGARFRRANAGGGGPAGRTRLPCDFTPCAAPPPAARS